MSVKSVFKGDNKPTHCIAPILDRHRHESDSFTGINALNRAPVALCSGYSQNIRKPSLLGQPVIRLAQHTGLNQKATTEKGFNPVVKGLPVTGVSAPVVALML